MSEPYQLSAGISDLFLFLSFFILFSRLKYIQLFYFEKSHNIGYINNINKKKYYHLFHPEFQYK